MSAAIEYIPRPLYLTVLYDSKGHCIACEASGLLQVDHIRPRHYGGRAVRENLCALCWECNRVKSCYHPCHGYHPFPGHDDPARAADIFEACLAHAERVHGYDAVLSEIWGWDCEPGTWAWKRDEHGQPRWLAALRGGPRAA